MMSQRVSGKTNSVLLVLALLLAGTARLAPHYDKQAKVPDRPESPRLALGLATRGEFASPFRLAKTGPSAYLSPGGPALCAALIATFGTGAKGAYAIHFAAALATAGELAFLPIVTAALGMGWIPGAMACLLGLLAPMLTFSDWEVSYAGLLAVMVTLFWCKFLERQTRAAAVLFGLTAGAVLLTSASAFAVIAPWMIYALWRFHASVLRSGVWLAVLVPVLVLTPWTVRNYVAFHRMVVFRTALGLALQVSNNDCASVGVRQTEQTGCLQSHSPNYNFREAEQARSLGEVEYSGQKAREVGEWIGSHPQRFATLTMGRILAFWFPYESDSPFREITVSGRRRERLMVYLATVLSFAGLIVLAKQNRRGACILGSWLLFFPLIYYVAMFEDRYRYPILWATLVCASLALCSGAELLNTWFSRHRDSSAVPGHPRTRLPIVIWGRGTQSGTWSR